MKLSRKKKRILRDLHVKTIHLMVFENTHRKKSRFIINRQSNAYVRNKPTELKNTFDVLVF